MSEPFLAEIKIVSFGFAPKGWAFCNGQIMAINQNQALFSLLGTTFGGDGRVNFALPNLQGRTPIHVSPAHPIGESAGSETITLNSSQLPPHIHGLNASAAAASSNVPTGNVPAKKARFGKDVYAAASNPVAMNPAALAPSGGSQPHTNMQPYLTLNFSIALQGIFPSQT